MLEALYTDICSHHSSAINRVSLLLDFRVGLDRDPGKSQSANREKDDCHSKSHLNVRSFSVTWSAILILCAWQFNRRRVMDSDDEDDY